MKTKLIIALSTMAGLWTYVAASQNAPNNSPPPAIVRRPLLMAAIEGQKLVDRVDIREIEFQRRQNTGLHLHPCPVVGYAAEGTIIFHVEGQAPKVLHAGDAFFEPADTRIIHFDNQEGDRH